MLENENQLVSALNEYQRLIDNFSLYLPMDSIINKMMSLRESTALKSQKKEREKYFQKERSLSELYFERFYYDLKKSDQNFKWWEKRIDNLKNEKKNAEGEEDKMLDRILYSVYALAIESVTIEGVDNLNQAVFCYDICIKIYPEHYLLYFKQIDNCLQLGKEDQAMDYLEKLILAGYQDIEGISTNSLFDPIRNKKRYQELIKQ